MIKKPRILREIDTCIIYHVSRSTMSRRKLNMVNKTRICHQVETRAEIANLDGTKIDPAWLGKGKNPSLSTIK